MPQVWQNDTRLGVVLPELREPEPPEQWIHKAVEEVKEAEAAGFTFTETSWGLRLRRRG